MAVVMGANESHPASRLGTRCRPKPMTSGSLSLEVPLEELFRRARPLPPHEEMVIEVLDEEEGAAFLATLER